MCYDIIIFQFCIFRNLQRKKIQLWNNRLYRLSRTPKLKSVCWIGRMLMLFILNMKAVFFFSHCNRRCHQHTAFPVHFQWDPCGLGLNFLVAAVRVTLWPPITCHGDLTLTHRSELHDSASHKYYQSLSITIIMLITWEPPPHYRCQLPGAAPDLVWTHPYSLLDWQLEVLGEKQLCSG